MTITDAFMTRPDLPCRRDDPDRWFPEQANSREDHAARKVCRRRCPAVDDCLKFALAHRMDYGIWGGASPEQRQAMVRGETVVMERATPRDRTPMSGRVYRGGNDPAGVFAAGRQLLDGVSAPVVVTRTGVSATTAYRAARVLRWAPELEADVVAHRMSMAWADRIASGRKGRDPG